MNLPLLFDEWNIPGLSDTLFHIPALQQSVSYLSISWHLINLITFTDRSGLFGTFFIELFFCYTF